jgi:thiol-disulfide isomerase/thioredoxin
MARRWRTLVGLLALAAAIVVAAVFGLASHPQAGRLAPALPRESLVGAPLTLSSYLASAGGRPVLVVFWASWCGPCAQEAPADERFSKSPAGIGRILGVDWSDARAGAVQFIHRYKWTFPNLRDAEGAVGNAYRITVLPSTVVLDRNGHIDTVLRGPQSERSLRAALAAASSS